ncbi:MAG: PEP-CTERM sorting domain-containing protein [Planctomycetia bacterium]|nr:PEP-CTERM sorting domain-containing protein [Planctomycetia bacterium]
MVRNWMSSRGGSLVAAAAIAGAALAGMAGLASASVIINGTTNAAPANSQSNPADISNGTAAWVYYGYNGQSTGMNTDSANAANFSSIKCPTNTLSPWTTGPAGYVTFTGASSGASENFVFVNGPFGSNAAGISGNSLSFTTDLLAPSETLNVYLISYNSRTDITATLASSSGGGSLGSFTTDAVLPSPVNDDPDNNGTGHGYGILTLNISGASTGDVLTVTDATDISTVTSPANNANVGFQAADVVVPEPATIGLVAVGGIGLLLLRRRKAV